MIENIMPPAGKRNLRLGELLIEQGLINTNQLKDALREQAQAGGQLGSILVEMGFITNDDLLNFLSRQLGIPSVNLFTTDIAPELLRLLPLEKIKSMKVIPIGMDDDSVTLAMVNPRDMISIKDIEFSLGKKVTPVVVPSSHMEAAIQNLISSPGTFLAGKDIERKAHKPAAAKTPLLSDLLKYLSSSPQADMLLSAGIPPCVKLPEGVKRFSSATLTPADCEKYARELMKNRDWKRFSESGDERFAITYPETGRVRVNLYRQRNSLSIAARFIPDILPSLEELRLPEWIGEYALMSEGLIIVSGPAGHGKSTTVSSMVDIINMTRRCNIITIEDPIEYLHKHKKSNVNQREVGSDTNSFLEGMNHVFGQDADVIVLGEATDADSISLALQAAATGRLVITSVLAGGAAEAIESLIDMFSVHQQTRVRRHIAENLLLVFSQSLVRLKDGEGRVLAHEKLANSQSVRDLILEGKTLRIKSRMQTGDDAFASLESSLAELCRAGLIRFEDGFARARDKEFFSEIVNRSHEPL